MNRRLLASISELPGVTVNDLYEVYPLFNIDVAREQRLLAEHDVIVFQHPMQWYSVPALLKEWQDLVLEYGWAYGEGGNALAGKITFNAVTAGASSEAYRSGGDNGFSMREFLASWDRTALLCNMTFLAPTVVHGAFRLVGDDAVRPYCQGYQRLLEGLREDRVDLELASRLPRLNLDGGSLRDGLLRNEAPGGGSPDV